MTIISILCLLFCCGIVLDDFFCLNPGVFICLLPAIVILSFIFLKARRLFYVLIFIAAFLAGALVHMNARLLFSRSADLLGPFQKKDVIVYGIAASDPDIYAYKTLFAMDVSYLYSPCAAGKLCGKVLVQDDNGSCYRFGEEVVLKGRLRKPSSYLTRGSRSGYAQYLERSGIYFIFSVDKDGLLVQRISSQRNVFQAVAFAMKHKAMALIARNMESEYASILYAILLGDRASVPASVKKAMIKIGVWHVLVVSGSHIILIMSVMLLFLKIARFPAQPRIFFIMGIVWFYCLLTGACVSSVRAVTMSSIFMVSYLLERKPHFYNTFFLSGLVILIFCPFQLFDLGFQLSFLSVFFIVWLPPKIKNVLPQYFHRNKISRWTVECFCVAFSAWLGTAPVLAYYFGNFYLLTVFVNMIMVPLSTLVVFSGFVLVLSSAVLKPAAFLIANSSAYFISTFLKMGYFFSNLPFGYVSGIRISLVVVYVCYFLIFILGLFLDRVKRSNPAESGRL